MCVALTAAYAVFCATADVAVARHCLVEPLVSSGGRVSPFGPAVERLVRVWSSGGRD